MQCSHLIQLAILASVGDDWVKDVVGVSDSGSIGVHSKLIVVYLYFVTYYLLFRMNTHIH